MSSRNKTGRLLCFVAILTIVFIFSACSTEPSETGTLRLTLVDAPVPIEGIEAIDIIFFSVLVHKTSDAVETDAGWITVLDDQLSKDARTFNLLELVNGASAVLGEAELDAGHYSQIRLIIQSATITIDGTTSELTIPSGQQSGLKLIQGFTVDPDVITELTIDFDAGQSIVENPPGSGNYKLQPTIRLVQTVLSGTISGTVTPLKIDAMVIAYEAGTETVVTSTYADTTTGEYVLTALLEGSYYLEAKAQGYNSATEAGVAVTAGQDNGGHDFSLTPTGGGN